MDNSFLASAIGGKWNPIGNPISAFSLFDATQDGNMSTVSWQGKEAIIVNGWCLID